MKDGGILGLLLRLLGSLGFFLLPGLGKGELLDALPHILERGCDDLAHSRCYLSLLRGTS